MNRIHSVVAAFLLAFASFAASAVVVIQPYPPGSNVQFGAPGLAVPLGVLVTDDGQPVANAPVTFTVVVVPGETANGFFPQTGTQTVTVATDAGGFAEVDLIPIAVGSVTVEAATPGAPPATFVVIVEGGSDPGGGGSLVPSEIRGISRGNLVTPVLATNTQPLAVQVLDGDGVPLEGAVVEFAAPVTGASGTFEGSPAVLVFTDEEGIAEAPLFTANGVAGNGVITATVPGTSLETTFRLVNTPAPSQHRCRDAGSRCRL